MHVCLLDVHTLAHGNEVVAKDIDLYTHSVLCADVVYDGVTLGFHQRASWLVPVVQINVFLV